jgi:MFS family permease
MLPLQLFTIRTISVSNLASFLLSAVLIAINAYLPLWIQGVYGKGATSAGLALMPMSLGWPLGAVLSGRFIIRYGARTTCIAGILALIAASLWLATICMKTSHAVVMAIMFIAGLGFGLSMTVFTVAVQSAVDWNLRGASTASNSFVRALGQTIGIAVFGTLFNSSIARYMAVNRPAAGTDMNQLLNPETAQTLPSQLVAVMREGLAYGLHSVFLVLVFLALTSLFVVFRLPRTNPQTSPAGQEKTSKA